MEWPKIKNIIIVILLLINGFLLVLVCGQHLSLHRYEQSALTRAAQVLEQNEISVSEEALEAASSLPSITITRSLEGEAELARTLLGSDAVCTDQSGGLYEYSSQAGTVTFRANGGFTAILSDAPLNGKRPANHAAALFKSMGLEGELLAQSESDESVTISFRQLLDGVPLYSCRLDFEYSPTRLCSISGTLLVPQSASVSADSSSMLDVPTALIRFLQEILERGDVCTAITGLQAGYLSTQSFGSTSLTPVWLVSTNITDYYLDGTTGALSRAD